MTLEEAASAVLAEAELLTFCKATCQTSASAKAASALSEEALEELKDIDIGRGSIGSFGSDRVLSFCKATLQALTLAVANVTHSVMRFACHPCQQKIGDK